MVLGVISVAFGLLMLAGACAAFSLDEPQAGLAGGMVASLFVYLGLKVLGV